MKNREVYVLKEAIADLEEGRLFYDRNEEGVGDYFYDSLISDLEALRFFGGIHGRKFGFYRMFSKRFPFAIYYEIEKVNKTMDKLL